MNEPQTTIYLASASPRRRELLRQIGVRFDVISAEIDERVGAGESAEAYVRRVALEKALAGRAALPQGVETLPVLGADTEVVVDGDVLGKPRDGAHALAMLHRLSGRTHHVLSAVALVGHAAQRVIVQQSAVTMRVIRPEEAAAYWASGEPAGKAGGYAVQGLGAIFIAHLQGSYSGVMGLPLYETAELLQSFGIEVLAMGARA